MREEKKVRRELKSTDKAAARIGPPASYIENLKARTQKSVTQIRGLARFKDTEALPHVSPAGSYHARSHNYHARNVQRLEYHLNSPQGIGEVRLDSTKVVVAGM